MAVIGISDAGKSQLMQSATNGDARFAFARVRTYVQLRSHNFPLDENYTSTCGTLARATRKFYRVGESKA